jgi:hypothetical protein
VILLSHGYVVAEGQIQGVRSEVEEQPMQIVVRCDRPPPFSVMVIDADPISAWIAGPGLLAVAGLILAYTALSARQTEISYGE